MRIRTAKEWNEPFYNIEAFLIFKGLFSCRPFAGFFDTVNEELLHVRRETNL